MLLRGKFLRLQLAASGSKACFYPKEQERTWGLAKTSSPSDVLPKADRDESTPLAIYLLYSKAGFGRESLQSE